MREFKTVNKTFVKSKNDTSKIFLRYTYSLIFILVYIIIYNLITKDYSYILNLIKTILIITPIAIIISYTTNLLKKEKDIKKIFLEDNILALILIITFFTVNTPIVIKIIAITVTMIFKIIFKSSTFYPSLYGILTVLIYELTKTDLITPLTTLQNSNYITTYHTVINQTFNLKSYIFGTNYNYLSPILAIIIFIYLFNKKSIKYNIVISYISTVFGIMLIFGLINGMNIWYTFFQLLTGNILFLSIFCLTDFPMTPTSGEGQVIYGITLGIISSILRFIVPELSIVISLILGPIILTKIINRLSFKLRYNQKFYTTSILSLLGVIIITLVLINIII